VPNRPRRPRALGREYSTVIRVPSTTCETIANSLALSDSCARARPGDAAPDIALAIPIARPHRVVRIVRGYGPGPVYFAWLYVAQSYFASIASLISASDFPSLCRRNAMRAWPWQVWHSLAMPSPS
jgi:hypothetical protein